MSWAARAASATAAVPAAPAPAAVAAPPAAEAEPTAAASEAVAALAEPAPSAAASSAPAATATLEELLQQQASISAASAAPSSEAPPSFAHLVVDTNAIIAGAAHALRGLSASFWTAPLAIAEVRDESARRALALLPFRLQLRVPSEAAIEAVRAFAAKTGDLRALSRVDLHLLALTYMLELEENGASPPCLRTEPPSLATALARPALAQYVQAPAAVADAPSRSRVGEGATRQIEGGDTNNGAGADSKDFASAATAGAESTVTAEAVSVGEDGEWEGEREGEGVEDEDGEFVAGIEAADVPSSEAGPNAGTGTAGAAASAASAAPVSLLPFDVAGGDDGEGEWIGPSSPGVGSGGGAPSLLPPTIAAASAKAARARRLVACVTTDFAMQNVLLQMGLLLATHSGKVVQSVKQWVLKCDACFTIVPISPTSIIDNTFCKRCGNATLNRLGVTLGADGTPRYHYKKFRQINTRATVFPLPRAQAGRAGTQGAKGQLLLRPDQLLTGAWKERIRQQDKLLDSRESLLMERTVDDALGQRSRHGGGGGFGGGEWAGPTGGPAPTIEYAFGKRNPNANRTQKHKA